MKETKNKKSITWWAGWCALWPLRFLWCLAFALMMSIYPEIFYSVMNDLEINYNQENWRIKW